MIEIDLHGMRLEEAYSEIDRRLGGLIVRGASGTKVRIITGKGRHSDSGQGTLIKFIHSYVCNRFGSRIARIDADPDELRIEGNPIRGHFDLKLKGR